MINIIFNYMILEIIFIIIIIFVYINIYYIFKINKNNNLYLFEEELSKKIYNQKYHKITIFLMVNI